MSFHPLGFCLSRLYSHPHPTPLISPPGFSRLLPDEWEIRPHQNMLYLNMQALARISWILKV